MPASAPKLAFDNGGAFIQDTRREVEQYLARGSTRVKGALMLYAKAPIALALTAVSWFVLILAHPGAIGIALCLLGLVVGATLTAFCVMHDANHGAYFKKRRWNHLVGWSADLAARLLELRLAREAQRRPPHVHQRRRLRRRRHAGAARPLHAVAALPALVSVPAVLHLADVHAHGAPLADARRSRGLQARQRRRELPADPARAGTSQGCSRARRSSSRGRS